MKRPPPLLPAKAWFDRTHTGLVIACAAIILLLPALMFHFMLPFTDTPISPSRDFVRYYVWHQLENMISVKFGSFPLYLPAASGADFCPLSAGYGQLYLPLAYLASLLPGYWEGYAADWLLLINLLTISLAHLALFLFLRELRFSLLMALTLTTITVYSPRILMCVGYGAGSAAWAGHLSLCALLGLYYLKPTRISVPLLIFCAAYWLINSGHPEEVYYCMLGTWLFAFLSPFVIESVSPESRRTFRKKIKFWLFWSACCAFAFLLSSAYIIPLYFEVMQHMDFADMAYEESVISLDTLPGLINNFFMPVKTGIYGCFSGTTLYLPVLLLPLVKLFRKTTGKGIWPTYLCIVLVFLYMSGEATPVFKLFWDHMPFASSTRNPARASLMMPVLFLLGLIWLFKTDATVPISLFRHRNAFPLRLMLAASGVVALLLGLALMTAYSPGLSAHARLNAMFIPTWVVPLLAFSGVLILLLAGLQAMIWPPKGVTELLLCGLICLHLTVVLRYNATPFDQKHRNDALTLEKLVSQKQKTLKILPDYLFLFEAAAHQAEIEQFKNYFIEPHLGQIYRKHRWAPNRQEAYRLLNQIRKQDEVVLENSAIRPQPEGETAPIVDEPQKDRVRLVYSTYNRLIFEAQACRPAFFLLSYPDGGHHWQAWVDGQQTPIYPANGISQAVAIPAGVSAIEFRYFSRAAFFGMATSCLTMAMLGVLGGMRCRRKLIGAILAAAIICLSAGLFKTWLDSLYTGRNFNTDYTWESPSQRQLSNLAYGKPCQISARNKVHTAYLHPRRGVDGDRSFHSCFITAHHANPWFQIDLEEVSTVGSIVITASLKGYEEDKMVLSFKENVAATAVNGIFLFKKIPVLFNGLPLIIAVSRDDEHWEYAAIRDFQKDVPHIIKFEEPVETRYIKIFASGTCRLCLNEVEVYPPETDSTSGS